MKFKDIKVGDKVLVPIRIDYGFRNGKNFYCLREVGRVTKAQFTVNDNRYRKSDGCMIGNIWLKAMNTGDKYYGNVLKDETQEMEDFRLLAKSVTKLRYLIEDMSAIRNNINIHAATREDVTECEEFVRKGYEILKKIRGI